MVIIKESEQFFKLQSAFIRIPFSQSKGWYSYTKAKNQNVVFLVDSDVDTKIACWGIEYRIPMTTKKILRIKGECFHQDLDEKTIKNFFEKLVAFDYEGFEIDSNSCYNINFEIGLRLTGFKRPIGLFSSPLTIEIDLSKDLRFNNNWKGSIRKSKQNKNLFKEIKEVDDSMVIKISDMFKELSDSKELGFYLDEAPLKKLLSSTDIRTFMLYDKENNPLAANIIHDNKPFATFIFAVNSLAVKRNGGTHFLVAKVIETLKREKFISFDLGRIPPSDHTTNGVYEFKKGTRGNKVQYNGDWTYYKSSLIEGAMYFYKRYFQKKQRY